MNTPPMNPPPPPPPPKRSATPPVPPRPPTAERAANAEAAFNSALARPPAERAAFLEKECGDDAALHGEVRALLAAHDAAGDFLKTDAPFSPEIEAELARLKPEEGGEMIGPYKLREQIGEGGFGTVWVADQERPVRRRVALKIIKMGMDTKEVIARFEQERQALALMDHPNIAKVLDAGATQYGRPFFVMELVRGVKITDYCDNQQLSTQERIELFITVCQAVQHAHQKGIIHRDLKPSNILVTVNDGKAVPKVIDFGVAKATQGRLTDATVYTQFQQMIGTPLYMSPEQAELTSLDIDTRSDIYALGVLLYELLTGHTPIEQDTLARVGLDEMRRMIREVDPPRPSMRVKTLDGAEMTTAAKRRNTEPTKLPGTLRGDIDWIVMKCLEKDRARRYDTANGLALDLQRHLSNEVITARPPTAGYLLSKLIRRNKLAFAAAAAVTLALVLGIVASLWQARRAQNEAARAKAAEKLAGQRLAESEEARAEAEAISRFMTDVFRSPTSGAFSDAGATMSRKITVLEALANAVKRLDADSTLPPARRARLQETIAVTYFNIGLPEESIPLREKTLAYYRATFGPDDPKTLGTQSELMHSYRVSKRTDEAIKLGEDALPRLRRLRGPDGKGTLWHSVKLAEAYDDAGRTQDALALREEIVPRMNRVHGPQGFFTLFAKSGLASSYHSTGRLEDALKLREEVVAATGNSTSPHTLWNRNQLANSYWDVGRREEAIALGEKTAALMRKILDPMHPWTFTMEGHLAKWKTERDGKPAPAPKPDSAEALSRAGKFAEAAQATREVIASRGAELGVRESIEHMILATTLLAAGDRDGYRAACAEAARRFRETTEPNHAERVAKICLLTPDSGVDATTVAAFIATAQTAGQPWKQLLNALAEYRLGHWDTAADWAAQARTPANPPDESATATAAAILAMAEHQRQHPAEARASLEAAKTAIAAHWPTGTGGWHDWLIADLLAKEAGALLR